MSKTFVSCLSECGPGDLLSFRDAVITYCAALREKARFVITASPEAQELLTWLGVRFEVGEVEGEGYTDSSLGGSLPSGLSLPDTPLQEFRDQGLLGTTLFAALVRSSYGPEEEGYFPTQSELGFYFDLAQLRQGEVRWDEDYLKQCQEFFFEELTPAELLELSLQPLSEELRHEGRPFQTELLGVAFLIGEQRSTLKPLTEFFRVLLDQSIPQPALQELASLTPSWDQTTLTNIWDMTDATVVEGLKAQMFAPVPDQIPEILAACGDQLISWRAQL